MFIKIQGTRVNTDKIVYYYAKPKTEFTKFMLVISYGSNWEEEDTYSFDDEDEGWLALKALDYACNVNGENNVKTKNTL